MVANVAAKHDGMHIRRWPPPVRVHMISIPGERIIDFVLEAFKFETSRIDVSPQFGEQLFRFIDPPIRLQKHRIDDDDEARHTCHKDCQEIDHTRRDLCTDIPSQRLSRARPPREVRFLGSRKVRSYSFRRGWTLEVQ
jgi:hypothetical protein